MSVKCKRSKNYFADTLESLSVSPTSCRRGRLSKGASVRGKLFGAFVRGTCPGAFGFALSLSGTWVTSSSVQDAFGTSDFGTLICKKVSLLVHFGTGHIRYIPRRMQCRVRYIKFAVVQRMKDFVQNFLGNELNPAASRASRSTLAHVVEDCA